MNLPQPKPKNPYRQQNIGNMLLAFSDVLKGRDPSAGVMQRTAMLDAQKKEAERKAAYDRQYNLLSPDQKRIVNRQNVGIDLPDAKDRRIVLQNGIQYYSDTGLPVLPDAPEKTPPKLTKSDYVVDILGKMKSNPGYVLTPTDQRILDTIADTDPMKIMVRNKLNEMQTSKFSNENNNQSGPVTVTSQEQFDSLPSGASYIYDGQEFVKGK